MKKLGTAAALLAAAMIAAGGAQAAEVTVPSFDKDLKLTTVTVPQDPKRIAVLDYATLDIIDSLGLSDRITAISKGAAPEYLNKYMEDDSLINAGTVKEISMEHLLRAKPELIFAGPRLSRKIGELSKIAPVVMLGVDYNDGLIPSVKRNVKAIEEIFNLQREDDFSAYEERLAKVREQAEGKSVVVGLVTASNFNALGNSGRCSLITHDSGFVNLAGDIKATHGSESSFELLVKLDPQYVFVLDRDSAINLEGAKLAQDLMDNDLVKRTQAYQNDHIIYLNSAAWYLAEGGYRSLDLMLSDLEKAFE